MLEDTQYFINRLLITLKRDKLTKLKKIEETCCLKIIT